MKTKLMSFISMVAAVALCGIAAAADKVTATAIIKDVVLRQGSAPYETGITADSSKWEPIVADAAVANTNLVVGKFGIVPSQYDGETKIILKWLGEKDANTNRVFNVKVATIEMTKNVVNVNKESKRATIQIDTHYLAGRPKVQPKAFFLGTACSSHSEGKEKVDKQASMLEAMTNAINGVATKASVDYKFYYDGGSTGNPKWDYVNGVVQQGSVVTGISDLEKVINNGNHAAMEQFYETLADLADNHRDEYDYIILEFDGNLLGGSESSHTTYVYNEDREQKVAKFLQRYYDLGRLFWVVNDWQASDPNPPTKLEDLDQLLDSEYFRPVQYAKGKISEEFWQGLLGLLNPDLYLKYDTVGKDLPTITTNIVFSDKKKKPETVTAKVGHRITGGIGNEDEIHWTTYTDADKIGAALKKFIREVKLEAIVSDRVNTNLTVVGGADGVKFTHKDSENGQWKTDKIGDVTVAKEFDTENNLVKGTVENLMQEWWTRLEINVEDNGFLTQDKTVFWFVSNSVDNAAYFFDPNVANDNPEARGPALTKEYDLSTEGKPLYSETNAWTGALWKFELGKLELDPAGVERNYDGTSTNATVVVKDATTEEVIEPDALTVCYGTSETGPWAEPVAYEKDAFRNVTNLWVEFIAGKEGYLTATSTPVQVWIKPLTVTVTAGNATNVYNGTGYADLTTTKLTYSIDGSYAEGEQEQIEGLISAGITNEQGKVVAFTRKGNERDVGDYDDDITTNRILTANGNYTVLFKEGDFAITQKVVTVTADDKSLEYGSEVPEASFYTYTYDEFVSGETEKTAVTTKPTFTSAYTKTTPVSASPLAITNNVKAEAKNYSFVYVDGKLTITELPTLVVTPHSAEKVYDGKGTNVTFTVTGKEGADITSDCTIWFRDNTEGTWKKLNPTYYVGVTNTWIHYAVECKGYAPVTNTFDKEHAWVKITPRTVEVNPKSYTKAYGEADPAKFEYAYNLSNVLSSDMDAVTNLLDKSNGSFARTAGENVGSYPITDKVPFYAGVNYQVDHGKGTLTITQRWVTVTAQDYTRKPGEANPTDEKIKAECTVAPALLPGDKIVYTATCTYEGDEPGTHTDVIVPSGAASQGNYHVTYVPGDLTITDLEPLKIFIDDRTVTYGDKAPTNLAFKTGAERYDRTDVDESKIFGLDTVTFATAYRQGDPVGGDYPIYTNSADLSSVYYCLTVVPGHVTVLPASITPVKPGEEPPADPTEPYTYAPDIVRYYDGAGTNINPVTVNLLPGNVPEYLFRLDGTDKFVPWKDLQITNVHYNADGSIKSNKVWYSVTTKPTNYYSATNYAWVTILPNVITVVAVDTNKVYGLDASRTPPTEPDPDFTWVVDWEKSAVASGEEAAVLAALEACEKAAPEGKILMRVPEPVTPEGKKPETDMEDVLDDRAPHYKRFDVITTNSLFKVVIGDRRNYRVEFIPGDFAIYPDDVVFASESGTFDYVGIYDGKPHTIDLYVIPGADHKGNPTEVSFATLAEGPWSEWYAYSDDWKAHMPAYTHVTNRAPVYVKARNVPNFYETNMVAYVTVTQRTVYVTAESAARDYDGTELRNGDFTVAPATADTGFVGDEGFGAVTMTDDSAITAVGSADNVIATTSFRDGTDPNDYRVVREKGLLTVTPAQILDDPTESAKPWAWTSDIIVWTNDVPEVTVVGTNIVVRTGLWTAEDDAKAVLRYSTVDPAVAQPSDWKESLTFSEICNTQVWCNVSCENYSPTNVTAFVVILSKAVDVVDEGAEEEDKPLPNPKTEEAVNAVMDGIIGNAEILETGDPNPNYDPTKPGWEAGQLDGHVYLAFTSIANLPQEEREAAELHLKQEAAAYKAANPNVRNFEARSVDVRLVYAQTFKDASKDTIESIGDTNEEVIPFTLAVDLSSDRQVLQVSRYHNGEKLPLTAPEGYAVSRNADDPANSVVTIKAKRYSEFIILTGEPYTPTPPGGCEPVEVTEDGLVYQFRAQLYTTKGVVQVAASSGSVCAPDESSTCLVMRGRDKTVIDGWLYSCTRTCSGLQDASVIMWDSRRKAKVTDAAFETKVLNVMGSRNTDAEWAWSFSGTSAYDASREQAISLQGAGYGMFDASKRLYTYFSGNAAGTAGASFDLTTKNSKAVSECICEPSQVLTCETYDTLAYEPADTVMFGRWKMKYNASASKLYGKKGTLKLPSYVKLDD